MADPVETPATAERDRYDDIMDGLLNPPIQRRARNTVRRILTAADALIAEHGYDRLATSDIVDRAECSIGILYRYFRDRVELLDALAPDRHAHSPLALDRALEQRDIAINLLAQARWALAGLSDRLDESSYGDLAVHLDDGPLDDDGHDLVGLRLAYLQAEEAARG